MISFVRPTIESTPPVPALDVEAMELWREEQDAKVQAIADAVEALVAFSGDKVKITPVGGLAVQLINKSGAPSIAGYIVTPHHSLAGAVELLAIDEPDPVGIFLESGVPDGSAAWVVVSGIAQVYFLGNVALGDFARMSMAADTGEAAGVAIAEAKPSTPFTDAKHWLEIGHVLEARTGAGLAKVILHFN